MENKNDYFLPDSWFISLAKIDRTDFKNMVKENPELQTNEGYPVFKVMNFWYTKYLKTKELEVGTQLEMERPDFDIEKQMRQQQLIKLLIQNMSKLAIFVPKSIAEGRILRTLSAVALKVKTVISESATQISKRFKETDHRILLEILTKKYNEVIDELYKESQNISWADEVDAAVIQRKMLEAANVDPEIKKMVENIYTDLEDEDAIIDE